MPELFGSIVLATMLGGLVVRDLLVLHGEIVRTLEASEPDGVENRESRGPGAGVRAPAGPTR